MLAPNSFNLMMIAPNSLNHWMLAPNSFNLMMIAPNSFNLMILAPNSFNQVIAGHGIQPEIWLLAMNMAIVVWGADYRQDSITWNTGLVSVRSSSGMFLMPEHLVSKRHGWFVS